MNMAITDVSAGKRAKEPNRFAWDSSGTAATLGEHDGKGSLKNSQVE
jgi:hypothetical protein